MDYYELSIMGLRRNLPIIKVSEKLSIASFVILGDCELVTTVAPFFAEKLKGADCLVTAEAKGVPLANEVCRLLGHSRYVVARKSIKVYMQNPLSIEVQSIITRAPQKLYLDSKDAEFIKGKNVALIDDVISTGESLQALNKLIGEAGANVIAQAAILAEGAAATRTDIIFIEGLPVFEDGITI